MSTKCPPLPLSLFCGLLILGAGSAAAAGPGAADTAAAQIDGADPAVAEVEAAGPDAAIDGGLSRAGWMMTAGATSAGAAALAAPLAMAGTGAALVGVVMVGLPPGDKPAWFAPAAALAAGLPLVVGPLSAIVPGVVAATAVGLFDGGLLAAAAAGVGASLAVVLAIPAALLTLAVTSFAAFGLFNSVTYGAMASRTISEPTYFALNTGAVVVGGVIAAAGFAAAPVVGAAGAAAAGAWAGNFGDEALAGLTDDDDAAE